MVMDGYTQCLKGDILDPHFHYFSINGREWTAPWPPNQEAMEAIRRIDEQKQKQSANSAGQVIIGNATAWQEPPEMQTPVDDALSRCGAAVQRLEDKVEELIGRLHRVLMPEPTHMPGPGQEMEDAIQERRKVEDRSRVLLEITVLQAHISDIHDRVEEALKRLEI